LSASVPAGWKLADHTSLVSTSRKKTNVPQQSRVVSSRHLVTASGPWRLNPEPAAVTMTV
jgi:hypothetical protein